MVAPPGVGDMIGASAEAPLGPGIVEVESERSVDTDRRMKALWRLPRPVTDAGDAFAIRAGWMQGNAAAVDRQPKALPHKAARPDLKPFERAINVAHRPRPAGFLAEHVPRLKGGAEFDLDVALGELANPRKTEL